MTIELKVIPTNAIKTGDRFRKDYGDLNQLIVSFREEGIIQPLAVKDMGDGTYLLAAGGRRFAAALAAKIEEIPVRIYPPELNEFQLRSIELMENIARKDLDWVETAKLREEIHNLHIKMYGEKTGSSPYDTGHSLRDTAKLLNEDSSIVSKDLKLAKALEMFPELRSAKTRHEAEKKLSQLQEGLIKAELAKRLDAKLASTPVEKLHEDLCHRYIVNDFLQAVKKLPDRSIDFCEVDPPYGIDLKRLKEGHDKNYIEESYNEIDAEKYIPFMFQVLSECYRVMTLNSWLVLWFGPDPWHEDMYQLLTKVGFVTTRITGMWYKGGTGQTLQPDRYLANCYESFYYARKGNPIILRQGRANVFHYRSVPPNRKIHPTERPIEMIQDLLQTFCWESGRVLVPFAGSGNTLLAAANLGMTAIGTDLTQEYKDSFIVRVHESAPPRYKSYAKEEE